VSELSADVRLALNLAGTVLEKTSFIDAGRQRADVVFGLGDVDRREMLHGQYSRLLLRQLDADTPRLDAVVVAWRDELARALAAAPNPDRCDYHRERWEVAAALAATAAELVRAAGMPPDAGPDEREAVMAEADSWLAHLEPGGRRRQQWARLRRRWILARAAHRR
jgi:hypothetical protein